LTDDLRPEWQNVALRLQGEARRGSPTFAVLSIRIVVDQNGNPRAWLPPERTPFEPKRGDYQWLVDLLT
jgi:hypothetical protein